MKKALSIALALAMLLALCTGCSGITASSPAASAAGSGASAPASQPQQPAGEPVTLIFGNASAPDKLGSIVMKEFCENLNEKSGGTINAEWYPNQELGSNAAQIESMMTNNQAGNFTSIDSYGTYVNDLNAIAVPFLFDDSQHLLNWLASDSAKALLDQLAKENNLRVINYNFVRLPRQIISTWEVKTPEDLKGGKARVANIPMQEKMFAYWGCSTQFISFAEYPSALMQGVINCGETSSESFSTSKFHLYAPYIAQVDFAYPLDCMVMSNEIFESLTKEQQDLIYECAQIASDHYNSQVNQEWEAYKPTMEEEGAIWVQVDRDAWLENAKGFWQQLADENFFTDPTLVDTIRGMVG